MGKTTDIADRPAHAGARHADRLEPAVRSPPRGRAPAPDHRGGRAEVGFDDGTRLDTRLRHLGHRLPHRPLVDRRAGVRRQRPGGARARSDRPRRASTSWASSGSTRGARLCSAGSRTTPSTSPAASRHIDPRRRRPARVSRDERPVSHRRRGVARGGQPGAGRARRRRHVRPSDRPVAKRLGGAHGADARLQRLDPRPDPEGAGRVGDPRERGQRGRHGRDRALARPASRQPPRRDAPDAGPDPRRRQLHRPG